MSAFAFIVLSLVVTLFIALSLLPVLSNDRDHDMLIGMKE